MPTLKRSRMEPGEGGRDRRLDGRGGRGVQPPQHPDPLLIGRARLLPEGGPDLLPHRNSAATGAEVASNLANLELEQGQTC